MHITHPVASFAALFAATSRRSLRRACALSCLGLRTWLPLSLGMLRRQQTSPATLYFIATITTQHANMPISSRLPVQATWLFLMTAGSFCVCKGKHTRFLGHTTAYITPGCYALSKFGKLHSQSLTGLCACLLGQTGDIGGNDAGIQRHGSFMALRIRLVRQHEAACAQRGIQQSPHLRVIYDAEGKLLQAVDLLMQLLLHALCLPKHTCACTCVLWGGDTQDRKTG